jgi:GTP cyclohydrolase III
MEFDLLSWGIGIPTGIGVNWLSYWLYRRFQRRRQAREAYLTVVSSSNGIDIDAHADASRRILNYSNGKVEVEVRVNPIIAETPVSADEIQEKLQEAYSSEREDRSESSDLIESAELEQKHERKPT